MCDTLHWGQPWPILVVGAAAVHRVLDQGSVLSSSALAGGGGGGGQPIGKSLLVKSQCLKNLERCGIEH